jgi:hypothetical protein
MAQADLLISLVKAGATGDQSLFRRTVEAMVAEERAKHHGVLAGQLEEQMNRNGALARMDAVPTRPQRRDRIWFTAGEFGTRTVWLPGEDSNLNSRLQRPLSYH